MDSLKVWMPKKATLYLSFYYSLRADCMLYLVVLWKLITMKQYSIVNKNHPVYWDAAYLTGNKDSHCFFF